MGLVRHSFYSLFQYLADRLTVCTYDPSRGVLTEDYTMGIQVSGTPGGPDLYPSEAAFAPGGETLYVSVRDASLNARDNIAVLRVHGHQLDLLNNTASGTISSGCAHHIHTATPQCSPYMCSPAVTGPSSALEHSYFCAPNCTGSIAGPHTRAPGWDHLRFQNP